MLRIIVGLVRPDSGEVRLKGDGRGHFVFEGAVNDRPITFMADTGATIVALTYEDARHVGLSPRLSHPHFSPRHPVACCCAG